MSGRCLLGISPCRSSLQPNSCIHQTRSHQGPVFPGNECTSFPCSRDLPETDPLLSFIIVISESDWSSFTSLLGYFRWGFPSWLLEGCLPPRSASLGASGGFPPPRASLSPRAHMRTHSLAADGLPASSAHRWCVHALLLSVCLIQEQISSVPQLLRGCGDVRLFPPMGLAFERLPLIPKQCSPMKADKLSLQESGF